ncbi:MAG: transglycosylase SLT domain-containing protein [Bdellovibrionales bacterium]|nr:transglycosylase SLT domain-containing protein [Bdellovibrionales bacterium]
MKALKWIPWASLTALVAVAGCAGPTTPLGSVRAWFPVVTPPRPMPHRKVALETNFAAETPHIRFYPERQVLHGRSPLRVVVRDPSGVPENPALLVSFNGLDVSESFLARAQTRVSPDGHQLEVFVPHVRLGASGLGEVEFRYVRSGSAPAVQARYPAPRCEPFKANPIRSTGRFKPPVRWMKLIDAASRKEGMNPNLLAGLIAQESGFDPKALSWAKALGLTQVTPLADAELEKYHADWPRFEEINETSFVRLKSMILTNSLSAEDDWRLNPKLSIQGGLTYLGLLNKYWRQEQNYLRVARIFEDTEDALTELVLASYNSGPSRVSKALKEMGPWYLSSPELREAEKYVARVTSYCDHFAESDEALEDESET